MKFFAVFLALFLVVSGQTKAASPTAADFANFEPMREFRISPDGTRILAIAQVEDRDVVYIQELGSGNPPQVFGLGGEGRIIRVDWANDGRLIAVLEFTRQRDSGVARETRLLSFRPDGSELKMIVKPGRRSAGPNRGDPVYPQWQHVIPSMLPGDDNHLLVAVDDQYDGWGNIRKIDITNGDYDVYQDQKEGVMFWLGGPGGQIFAWGEVGYVSNPAWGSLNMPRSVFYKKGPKESWTKADFPFFMEKSNVPQGITPDGSKAYVFATGETGLRELALLDLTTGEIVETIFAPEGGEPLRLVFAPGSELAIGVIYMADRKGIFYFDEAWAARHQKIAPLFPDALVEIISSSKNLNRHIIRVSSEITPGDYYVFYEDRNELKLLAKSVPNLDRDNLYPVRAVTFTVSDGQDIRAYITGPEDQNRGTVLLLHDGPEFSTGFNATASPNGRAGVVFNATAQFLAAQGFLVVQPNFRGSAGYGEGFEDVADVNWGGEPVRDVIDAARWLAEEGLANADQLFVMGRGFGGFAALKAAEDAPNLFAGVIAINAPSDLYEWVRTRALYFGAREWLKRVGDERANNKLLKEMSPSRNLEKLKVPVLLFHTRDNNMILEVQSKRLARSLKKRDLLYKYVRLEFGSQDLWNVVSLTAIFEQTEEFLNAQ
ncbi:MAG: prolyl oligopeptidase family serine peptidase [Alphaproteobacteria bacterium]